MRAGTARAEFSANAAITTDYLFYGLSQSSQSWAIQGGVDYTHEDTGIYFGTWASSIDFNVGASDPAPIELDVFGGIAGELGMGLSWDVGIWYYGYPGQNEDRGGGGYDYFEVYASFGYTFEGVLEPTIGFGINVSPDFFGEDGTSYYPQVSLDLSLPEDFGFYVSYAYLDVEGDKTTTGFNYGHYSVGLTRTFLGLDFDVSYNDADSDCGGDICEAFVFTVSKTF